MMTTSLMIFDLMMKRAKAMQVYNPPFLIKLENINFHLIS
jgi:hypothetical protein